MVEERPKQILLLAPSLLGESLALKLSSKNNNIDVILDPEDLIGLPKLILFCIENIEVTNSIKYEILKLKQRWDKSPVLIVIPRGIKLASSDLLNLGSEGIIQDPTVDILEESINILLQGGRVFKLNNGSSSNIKSENSSYGLGYWLLTSGLAQINQDLHIIELLITKGSSNPFYMFILLGRKRELLTSRKLLYWLWGPIEMLIEPKSNNISFIENKKTYKYQTDLTIPNSESETILNIIYNKLENKLQKNLSNTTSELLALDSLNSTRRNNLFNTLLCEFRMVINKIKNIDKKEAKVETSLDIFSPELRKNTLRKFINSYERLLKNGKEISIIEYLLENAELDATDDELPSIDLILEPILNNKPILLEGEYLSIEDPRALNNLEMLILNWIIRTAEIISAELISLCSEWPELRKYMLVEGLTSTRELERRRNQINTKNQLHEVFRKPVRLYESKRSYYTVENNQITKLIYIEPRDIELRNLEGIQKNIAFIIELRDALAPQIQAVIQYTGDLIVLILTKVIGRSIGLIGKGIAQGMGKNLSKG